MSSETEKSGSRGPSSHLKHLGRRELVVSRWRQADPGHPLSSTLAAVEEADGTGKLRGIRGATGALSS